MALGIVKIYLGSPFSANGVVRGRLVRGQFVAVSCRGPLRNTVPDFTGLTFEQQTFLEMDESFPLITKYFRGVFWKNGNKSNRIFHYTGCIMPKRVISLRGSPQRHCAQATQLLLKKCRSGGEP